MVRLQDVDVCAEVAKSEPMQKALGEFIKDLPGDIGRRFVRRRKVGSIAMKSSRAKGKVLLAIDRLAAEKPLHAGFWDDGGLLEDTTLGTMAVGFRHGRLILYFSPTFVEGITLDELIGVVEHECNHVLLQHVIHDPPPNENRNARIVAEECSANEWVSHPLPGKPISYRIIRAFR